MICPMCAEDVEGFHKRSHVLPDWMFKESYSENHKLIQVDMNKLTALKKQTAVYGTFWCKDCETRSCKDDTYGSLLLASSAKNLPGHSEFKRQTLKSLDKDNPGLELWSGFDFKSLQNFIFSILLRGDLFRRLQKRNIMGAKHFDNIRDMYFDSNYLDDGTYPIMMVRSPDTDPLRNYSFLPHHSRLIGHNTVLFRGGGFQFQICVSSHAKPEEILVGRIRTSGEMPVYIDNYENTGSFKSSVKRLADVARKHPAGSFGLK